MSRDKQDLVSADSLSVDRQAAVSAGNTVPSGNTVKESSGIHFLALVGIVVLATAAVITVVVMLTPLEDESAQGVMHGPPTRPSVDALAQASVVLPREGEAIDVKHLQHELRALADKLAESFPDQSNALLAAGLAYSELQQSQRAVEVLRRCVAMSPPLSDAYVGLAKNLTLLGENEEAVSVLRLAVTRGQANAQVAKSLAEALATDGRLEEAADILDSATGEYGDDAAIWLQLGQTLVELRQFEKAEASIRQAMRLGAVGVPSFVALSSSLTRQGKMNEAAEVRKQLMQQSDHLSMATKNGVGTRFQDDFSQRLRGSAVQILNTSAKVYMKDHDEPNAAQLLQRSLALDPHQVAAYLLLVDVYRQEQRLPDVLVVLQRLIELQPNRMSHYNNLASLAAQLGDYKLAERVLQQAVQGDIEGGMASWTLGLFFASQGRNKEALKAAQVAAERLHNVDAYLLLMSTYQAVGNEQDARAAYEKAKQLDPNDPRLREIRF